MYIEASPLLIFLFLLGQAVYRAAVRRKEQRDRVVTPYWGEEIPGRPET